MQRKNKSRSTSATSRGGSGGRETPDIVDDDYSAGVVDAYRGDKDDAMLLPSHASDVEMTTTAAASSTNTMSNSNNISTTGHTTTPVMLSATVKRNKCGTRPFDDHWLNLDCCGLTCATVTYLLHLYGVYAFAFVLLPPWMSITDEDGYREVRGLHCWMCVRRIMRNAEKEGEWRVGGFHHGFHFVHSRASYYLRFLFSFPSRGAGGGW
jgi:hypothetical protein